MEQSYSAPDNLESLRLFVNTLNVEDGTDRLQTVDDAQAWLLELGWPDALDEEDLVLLRRLREAFRGELLRNAGHPAEPDSTDTINQIARQAPLVVDVGGEGPRLSPGGTGVTGILGRLLADYYAASIDGTWSRLKACGCDTCLWAYYDQSRNGSRVWCSSTGCGNRMAARAYRNRQRQDR